jgi:mono/diheme cytochrome c family protein
MLNQASLAGNDEVMRTLILSGTDRMPAFRHYLKADEIDAIIAYVRTVPAPATVASTQGQPGAAR